MTIIKEIGVDSPKQVKQVGAKSEEIKVDENKNIEDLVEEKKPRARKTNTNK